MNFNFLKKEVKNILVLYYEKSADKVKAFDEVLDFSFNSLYDNNNVTSIVLSSLIKFIKSKRLKTESENTYYNLTKLIELLEETIKGATKYEGNIK